MSSLIHFFAEASCVCVFCVLLGSTSQCIFEFFSFKILIMDVFSQWYLFNFPLLTFSSLSRGYTQFHPNSSEIWERKKERKRERVWFERLESHKFIGIFWCGFYLVSQCVCFLGEFERWNLKSLSFRLHYIRRLCIAILLVCEHFWMQELMWLPKMWEEREIWGIFAKDVWCWEPFNFESVSGWMRWGCCETVKECWVDQLPIFSYFWLSNHFKQDNVCVFLNIFYTYYCILVFTQELFVFWCAMSNVQFIAWNLTSHS